MSVVVQFFYLMLQISLYMYVLQTDEMSVDSPRTFHHVPGSMFLMFFCCLLTHDMYVCMKICGSVVSLSFVLTHIVRRKIKNQKKLFFLYNMSRKLSQTRTNLAPLRVRRENFAYTCINNKHSRVLAQSF